MQLFIGVWPPPKVVKALADYPRPAVEGVRWSTSDQWLVKVRALGHVADAVVPHLVDTLRDELVGAPKTKVRFGVPAGSVWLHVPVEGLDDLGATVFDVTESLVPVTHPQPFVAEITLARGTRVPRELAQPLTAAWTVGEVVLARGTRTPAGPGYETVEVFPLG